MAAPIRGNPRTRRSGIPAAIAVRHVGAGVPTNDRGIQRETRCERRTNGCQKDAQEPDYPAEGGLGPLSGCHLLRCPREREPDRADAAAPGCADEVRSKLKAPGIREAYVADAVGWARRK